MFEVVFLRRELLLLVAPAVLATGALWYINVRARLQARSRYGKRKSVNGYSEDLSVRSELPSLVLWQSASIFLMLAAAGPSLPAIASTVPAGSEQVIVVLDVSDSMMAEQEYRPILTNASSPPQGFGPYGNRIDMVRQVVITQIMPALAGNELGIVTYAGKGWVQVDLITDFESTKWVLRHWVKVGSAPGAGSDYAEGLKTAIAVFDEARRSDERERVIVLFSDGGFTGTRAELVEAMQQLHSRQVRLLVVGVGDTSPVLLPLYNDFGQLTGYRKDSTGANANVALNEGNLVALANMSARGNYTRLSASPDAVPIDWTSALSGTTRKDGGTDIYAIPLAASLLSLLVLFLGRPHWSRK